MEAPCAFSFVTEPRDALVNYVCRSGPFLTTFSLSAVFDHTTEDLPDELAQHLATPCPESSLNVREEVSSTLSCLLQKMTSPRKKRARRFGPDGQYRDCGEHSPKKIKRRVFTKVDKAVRDTCASGIPTECCELGCCDEVGLEDVMARNVLRKALPWNAGEQTLLAEVLRCRDRASGRRQSFTWRLGNKVVCKRMFCLWHGISDTTLRRKTGAVRNSTGVLPVLRAHGNWRKVRHGKGRTDCADWLGRLFARIAEPFPNLSVRSAQSGALRTKEFLPTGLFATLQSVYDHYTASTPSPVSYVTFRRAWLQHHFQVSRHTLGLGSVVFGTECRCESVFDECRHDVVTANLLTPPLLFCGRFVLARRSRLPFAICATGSRR